MAETILGIEVSQTVIRAVQIKRISFKKFTVTKTAQEPLRLITPEERGNLVKDFIEKHGLDSDRFVVNFPGNRVFYRVTYFPFTDEKKIGRTIKYELESTLPVSVDELVVGFTTNRDEEGKIQAFGALIPKSDLNDVLNGFQESNIDPEVITVDGVALGKILQFREPPPVDPSLIIELNTTDSHAIWVSKGKTHAIKNLFVGLQQLEEGEAEIHGGDSSLDTFLKEIDRTITIFNQQYSLPYPRQFFLTGEICEKLELYHPVRNALSNWLSVPCESLVDPTNPPIAGFSDVLEKEHRSFTVALGLALLGLSKNDTLNLRQDEFAARFSFKNMKKEIIHVGITAGILLFLLLGNLFFKVSTDKKVYHWWHLKLEQEFKSVFPGRSKFVKPVDQMQAKVGEMKKTVEFFAGEEFKVSTIDILREIHQSIRPDIKVHLGNLSINPDNVRISGQTDSFNTVDLVKNLLGKSSYFKDIKITNAKVNRSGKGVSFKILAERAK